MRVHLQRHDIVSRVCSVTAHSPSNVMSVHYAEVVYVVRCVDTAPKCYLLLFARRCDVAPACLANEANFVTCMRSCLARAKSNTEPQIKSRLTCT